MHFPVFWMWVWLSMCSSGHVLNWKFIIHFRFLFSVVLLAWAALLPAVCKCDERTHLIVHFSDGDRKWLFSFFFIKEIHCPGFLPNFHYCSSTFHVVSVIKGKVVLELRCFLSSVRLGTEGPYCKESQRVCIAQYVGCMLPVCPCDVRVEGEETSVVLFLCSDVRGKHHAESWLDRQ